LGVFAGAGYAALGAFGLAFCLLIWLAPMDASGERGAIDRLFVAIGVSSLSFAFVGVALVQRRGAARGIALTVTGLALLVAAPVGAAASVGPALLIAGGLGVMVVLDAVTTNRRGPLARHIGK
jgi:hypothetical protein